MEARAVGRYLRISPTKARQVIDLIRGKSSKEAISILSLTQKKASYLVEKVLSSAMANAKQRDAGIDPERLYIKEAYVDEGPRLRRFRARAMGRASRIIRRTSHITILVADREG